MAKKQNGEMAKKQAVVVIHGMGEQIPMGTLRSLVKSVWEKDPKLRSNVPDPAPETKDMSTASGLAGMAGSAGRRAEGPVRPGNRWWIKPDDRAGLQELRRVTTGPLTGKEHDENWPKENGGRRTDFYEFYWADLMQGTTWQHLASWVSGLLLRSPSLVPKDVFVIWTLLWLIAIFALIFAVLKVLNLGLGQSYAVACTDPEGEFAIRVCSWLPGFYEMLVTIWDRIVAPVLMLVGIGAAVWIFGTRVLKGLRESWRVRIAVVLALIIGALLWPLVPPLLKSGSLGVIAAAVAAYLLNQFLKNYFGDVARYVQATPANVERRKLVRDRGIALLTGLHESGEYDRIVIVSHSLGTIVAYDLVNILWSRLGPHHENASADKARRPLTEMDAWLASVSRGEEVFAPAKFRELQRAVCDALSEGLEFKRGRDGKMAQSPWLISDLITVGSPLAHAEFLLARDEAGLDKLVEERILPVCPPVLESTWDEKNLQERRSFMYRRGDDGKTFAHHASCFAAVRWTNIYDKPPNPFLFMLGDAISGSVIENFGRSVRVVDSDRKDENGQPVQKETPFRQLGDTWLAGIEEEKVKIHYGSGRIPRLFTHTEYWNWQMEYDGDMGLPEHIRYLRNAIDLDEAPAGKRKHSQKA